MARRPRHALPWLNTLCWLIEREAAWRICGYPDTARNRYFFGRFNQRRVRQRAEVFLTLYPERRYYGGRAWQHFSEEAF